MKKTLFIILILCSIGKSKADDLLTAQYPDKITFKGKEYNLNSNPLEPYFEKYPDKRPKGDIISTALWRGYIAHFEIIDDQLYLTDIEIEVADRDSKNSYPYKWISVFHQVFPNTNKIKVNWYTGILILPHGKMVDYVHMGFASTFRKYWLLEIDKGDFREARKYRNKEFVKFKKRQFQIFERTEEYQNLYDQLLANSYNEDEEFIKSFIADFVIDYTSRFLTD